MSTNPPPTMTRPGATDDRPLAGGASDLRRPVVPALVLIAVGIGWGLHLLGVPVRLGVVLPVALVLIGVGVLIGGTASWTRTLVAVGTWVAIIAVAVVVVPIPLDVGVGDRDHRVTTLDELESAYTLGIGELTVDLRELELPAGTTTLEARLGIGQVNLRVPGEVTVVVDGVVGLGQFEAFGTTVGGIAPGQRVVEEGEPGAGTLEIEASVGLGQLEVLR